MVKYLKLFAVFVLIIFMATACATRKKHIPYKKRRPCRDCPTFSQKNEEIKIHLYAEASTQQI